MSCTKRIANASWPPDLGSIDFSDPDWVTVSQATGIARLHERTIRKLIATEDVAIKSRGKVWISRRRMMAVLIHSDS